MRNPDAIVRNVDTDIGAPLFQGNFNITAEFAILNSVVNQVEKQAGEKVCISHNDRRQKEILNFETDLFSPGFFRKLVRGSLRHDLKIHLLKGRVISVAFCSCDIQKLGYQL